MKEPKPYIATSGKEIDKRDQLRFHNLLGEVFGEDYDPILGQGLFLDAQKENKGGREAVYGFYRRIMDIQGQLSEIKPSTFAGEAKKQRLSQSIRDTRNSLIKQNVTKNNLYHRLIISGMSFEEIGHLVRESAEGAQKFSEYKDSLLSKLPTLEGYVVSD